MDQYTPKIIKDDDVIYGEICVELERCGHCHKPMLDLRMDTRPNGIFPRFHKLMIEAQMQRAGWVARSDSDIDEVAICRECEKLGIAAFTCYGCKEKRASNLLEQSFGSPPDHLCHVCYSTMSAKAWDELLRELEDEHKYDYC